MFRFLPSEEQILKQAAANVEEQHSNWHPLCGMLLLQRTKRQQNMEQLGVERQFSTLFAFLDERFEHNEVAAMITHFCNRPFDDY